MRKVRVLRERDFCPHHVLLGSASCALEDAEEERSGYLYYQLSAITFSALAIEAMGNSFGDRLYSDWKDFESCSPLAKIRLVAERLKIDINFMQEPYSTVKWLIGFRNKVAHAKPESVKIDTEMNHEEFERSRTQYPESKMERDITLANAKRSVKAVEDILFQWCEHLPDHEVGSLLTDGWSGSASLVEEAANQAVVSTPLRAPRSTT